MPELSRRQIAQLVLLVLVIANVGLFAWERLQRESIKDQERKLAALGSQSISLLRGRNDPALLKQEIDEAEKKLRNVSLAFPSRVDTVALQDHIVQVARLNQVQISNLSVQPPATRPLAGTSYPVVVLSVQARGDLHDLYGFLGQAQKHIYNTSSLENVGFTQGERDWSIKFDVVVYSKR